MEKNLKNMIKKVTLVSVVGLMSITLLTGCNNSNNTGPSNKLEIKSEEDYMTKLDESRHSFNNSTDDFKTELSKITSKLDDPFPVIDQTLFVFEEKGTSYESLIANLSESIKGNEEAIKTKKYGNVNDRVLRMLLLDLQHEGYDLIFKDNLLFVAYNPENILKEYEKQLKPEYIKAKQSMYDYRVVSVLNLPEVKEDEEIKPSDVTLKYDVIKDIIIDLDKQAQSKEIFQPMKDELNYLNMYYLSLLSGVVQPSFIFEDTSKTIDINVLKTFEEIRDTEGISANLKDFIEDSIKDIKENNTVDENYLTLMSANLFVYKNKLDEEANNELNIVEPDDLPEGELKDSLTEIKEKEKEENNEINAKKNEDDNIEKEETVEKLDKKEKEKEEETTKDTKDTKDTKNK